MSKMQKYSKEKLDKMIVDYAKSIFKELDVSQEDTNYLISKKSPKELYGIIELIHKEISTKPADPEGIGQVITDIIEREKAKK